MRTMKIANAVWGGLAAVGVVASAWAGVPGEAKVAFDLEAQPLSAALNALALQSQLHIVFNTADADGLQAQGVRGTYTPTEALTLLLKRTNLSYEFVDARTVEIRAGKKGESKPASTNVTGQELRLAQSEPVSTSPEVARSQARSADATPSAGGASGGLEEVIVSAQKRQQRLQDVPTSMVVLSGDALEARGIDRLADFSKQVPGFQVVGARGPGEGKPVVRGISTSNDRSALVAIYLDDVPFTPSSVRSLILSGFVFDPSLADIDHVEVLKGPQSTFYGANALTGLLKFVSRRPNLVDYGASLRVEGLRTESGGSGYNARLSTNIPLIQERLGARISAVYREDPGYVDNTFQSRTNVNQGAVKGVRASVLGVFTENLETTLNVFVQDIHNRGLPVILLNRTTLQPLNGFAYASPVNESRVIKFRSLSDTLVLKSRFATLTNTASYAEFSAYSLSDLASSMPLFGAPSTVGAYTSASGTSKRYTDELRLTSNPGRFSWMLGAYYTDEKPTYDSEFRGTDTNGVILPTTSPFYNVYTATQRASYEEKAGFGNATFQFNDFLEVTVGGRYTTSSQDYRNTNSGLFTFGSALNNFGFPTEDTAKNYLATVTWKPTGQLTAYMRAANAFRPGGANLVSAAIRAAGAPEQYRADTLWNYEVGVKGAAWASKLTYSAAAYHMKWKDVQAAAAFASFSIVGNVAAAKGDGAELSLNISPMKGLDMTLNGTYSDTEYTASVASLGVVRGDPLPYSPKLGISSLVDYRHRVTDALTANAGMTYAHYSDQRVGAINGIRYQLPAYDTLDFRSGLDWSRYSAILRIDNVLDQDSLTSLFPSGFAGAPMAGVPLRPRTYALSFEVRL